MTDFVIQSAQFAPPGAPGGDPGLLRRALEIALEGHPGGRLPEVWPGPPGDLARTLCSDPRIEARTVELEPAGIPEILASGASVLAWSDEGWTVARGRDLHTVSGHDERREPATARALLRRLGGGPREVVVLEPRLGLASLGRKGDRPPSPWQRLRKLMALERRELGSLVLYALVLGALSLAVPVAVQVLVNTIAFGSLLQPLVVLAILLFAVLTFGGVVQVMEWYAVEVLQRRIFVRVSEDLARRLASVRHEARDRVDLRELSNRFFEVVNLQKSAGRLLLDGLTLALQTAVGLLLLAFYHPVLLAFDVGLLVALSIVLFLGRGAVRTAVGESRAKYRVAAWLQTVAGNPVLFRSPAGSGFAAVRADSLTRDYLRARRTHYRRVLRQLIGGVGLQVTAMVALLAVGGWLVMRGELTLGQLVAAELMVGLVGAGFAKLGKHLESGYDLLASLDKLGKLLDLPDDGPPPQPRARRGAADLELDGLRLSSDVAPVAARVTAGERVLVDGRVARHVSAFLEVLAGLRTPAGGAVRVGGGAPREAHTMLLRPADVVEGTLLDNLRVVRPDLGEAEADRVLRTVRLQDALDRLKSGLHTPILGDGAPLSRPELARLAVARALVARPNLLLVDGVLDDLGLPEAELDRVLDVALGTNAPWTAVVASRSAKIRARCDRALALAPGGDA